MLDPQLTHLGVGVAFGRPIDYRDPREVYLYAAHIAARPKGARSNRGSGKPRSLCPYWHPLPGAARCQRQPPGRARGTGLPAPALIS